MIGNIVGGPDEVIERENQRAVARMDDPRRHRKVLVTMGLAGSQFARGGHRMGYTCWTWPFPQSRVRKRRHAGSLADPHIWEIRGQNQCYLTIFEDSHPHAEQADRACRKR